MLVLFETPAGYALFKGLKEKPFEKVKDPITVYSEEDSIASTLQLDAFTAFKEPRDALIFTNKLIRNLIPKNSDELLKNNAISGDVQNTLMTYGNQLESTTISKLDIDCSLSKKMAELTRGIEFQLNSLIDGLSESEKKTMSLGLAHGLSRYKLRFSTEKVDTMIIQAVSLIEDLDREITKYTMRLKEWYGWHFPELSKIVTEDVLYARTAKAVGIRTKRYNFNLSEFLSEDVEAEVTEAAEISLGNEINESDEQFIRNLACQVIELSEYRESLTEYLKTRMNAIAPNLTQIVGELIGAKLIAHAGSLINLAKYPASTIQILGAEKALFKAIKTNNNTPKYGLIYQASLIGQSSDKIKGKLSRTLAAKCSVCIRVDALGESENGSVGDECRTYLETRLKFLETSLNQQERSHNHKKHRPHHANNHRHSRQMDGKYNRRPDFSGIFVQNHSREFIPGMNKRRITKNCADFDEGERNRVGRKKRRHSSDLVKLNGQNFS